MLEDGTVFHGSAIGALGESFGELCFNTAMCGYQELLTDPSNAGQIVVMSYPLIGNSGIAPGDNESDRVHAGGLVVRELSRVSSNWRSTGDLEGMLNQFGITGIEGVDTRALVRHIRREGSVKSAISSTVDSLEGLAARLQDAPGFRRDLARYVTTQEAYRYDQHLDGLARYSVVVLDYGIKKGLLRGLNEAGCTVTVLPAFATASDVLRLDPDGAVLSSGPGDPEAMPYAIDTIRELLGKLPMMGVSLGHQLLALALGGHVSRMKHGHRGVGQPVVDLETGKVEMTCQNHGFVVEEASLDSSYLGNVEVTHLHLNDRSCEGLRCSDLSVFSVQYQPEAAPGPHDSGHIFKRFIDLMS